MSRSGYDDNYGDEDPWGLIRYRGAVKSAFRGKRGQAFLKEMLEALDALPEKRLITEDLVIDGENGGFIVGGDRITDEGGAIYHIGDVCALGAVGVKRGLDMAEIDPHCIEIVAPTFGVAEAMAREIVYENDDGFYGRETPEQRFQRMRKWVAAQIKDEA